MKITRTELKAVAHEVEDVVEEMASIPVWLGETMKDTCDCCRFPFERGVHLTALRLKSGSVMLIHAECISRLRR